MFHEAKAEVAELIRGVEERGAFARCDAVVSGYLGEAGTAAVVLDAVRRIRAANSRLVYCCDPVIGETHAGIYVRPGVPEAIRDRLDAGSTIHDLVGPEAQRPAADVSMNGRDLPIAENNVYHTGRMTQ